MRSLHKNLTLGCADVAMMACPLLKMVATPDKDRTGRKAATST